MKLSSRKLHTSIRAILLSLVLAFVFLSASGCFSLFNVAVTDISFTVDELALEVDERIEISDYIKISPALATDKSYTVSSSNAAVLTVSKDGSRVVVRGSGVGSAVLTAKTKNGRTATLNVSVSYAQPDSVTIEADEKHLSLGSTVVVLTDNLVPVEFTASLPLSVDPKTEITWLVNGEKAGTTHSGEKFVFEPKSVGRNTITAAVTCENGVVVSDECYVNVCDPISDARVAVVYGSLVQEAGENDTVRYTVTYAPPGENNPDPIITWFVNGEYRFSGEFFDFVPPSVGRYAVTALINGTVTATSDDTTVIVRGTVLPRGVWVDYDNCYPKVFVRWDDIPAAAGYEVSIIDNTTGKEVGSDKNSFNKGIADKFTSSSFDATEYFDGAANIFNTSFSVRVKTLGDGMGILTESDYSEEYITEILPTRAKSYLADKFYDGARNRYVRSFEEFYEWFEYAMLFRPSALSSGEKLYLDYDFDDAMDEIERAMNESHFTGMYSYSGAENKLYKNECTFRINLESANAPTKRTDRTEHKGEAWGAMRPHVNYDGSKARPSSYVFPIDKRTPVSVETSDQLYYLAQIGYSPVPVAGSAAEKMYNYARRTLRYIITDGMTDVQKAHAIYDWIMWRVIYDTAVTTRPSISESVLYEAYYLESVFTDSDYYGVCDAMSKAYSLMCNIEGIDCIRITGTAGNNGVIGGHAWNKVKLYGEWYVVDCTWGDYGVQLVDGGLYKESASHEFLFVTENELNGTHTEDVNMRYPATAKTRYPWYAEEAYSFEGRSLTLYLGKDLNYVAFREKMNDIAAFIKYTVNNSSDVYAMGPNIYTNRTTTQYYAFEIVADSSWTTAQSELRAALLSQGYTVNLSYVSYSSKVGNENHITVYMRMH